MARRAGTESEAETVGAQVKRAWNIPEARRLREAGELWPQTLSNAELVQEFGAVDVRAQPITACMLQDEIRTRRIKEKK